MAEEINDWFRGGAYEDLVSFEIDIAELSSVIVLFVESAGSIAELGLFSQLQPLRDKLLVFVRNGDFDQNSFIRLGPLDSLGSEIVCVYPWQLEKRPEYDAPVLNIDSIRAYEAHIADDITERLHDRSHAADFDVKNRRHILLLICDLISHMLAVKQKELFQYLNELGVEIDISTFKRYLFTLEKIGFIQSDSRGHNRYYLASNNYEFIRYRVDDSKITTDRERRELLYLEYYRENDPRRFSCLQSVLQSGGVK